MLIFDLEDAVSPEDKASSRADVVDFLESLKGTTKTNSSSPRIAVRINCPMTTDWGLQDLEALAGHWKETTLVIPKVNSVQPLQVVERYKAYALWPMMETPAAILNSSAIAANEAVEALVLGCNDLTTDLKAKFTESRFPLFFR